MNTISYDIFDTCLVRICGTPSSFFDVLSRRVFTTEVDEMTRQEFVIQRKRAEKSLWDRPSTNIYDIYNALSFRHPALVSVGDLVEMELSLEKEMLVPVLSIRNEIDCIHRRGGNVLYISDMYIPGSFLVDILKSFGLFVNGDKIFVSCDYGARKNDGGLFKLIHSLEGINYRDWKHKGDNVNGDFIQPKKLGIRGELVNNDYSPIQKGWQSKSSPTRYDYAGIISGLSRSLCVSMEYTERRDFILDLIAPMYCSYVYKVLSDATKKRLARIFFCARDTYQMYRLAVTMQPMFPKLEIKYLRISRTALYEGDAESRMRYFVQEGLASVTEKCAIVDSTSSGKTARIINEELSARGYVPISAYYLLKWDDQGIDMSNITFDAIIRQQYVDDRGVYISPNSVLLLENFFSTNGDDRTVNYILGTEGIVEPVFSSDLGAQDAIQDDVLKWQEYEAAILSEYCNKMKLLGLLDFSDQILSILALPAFGRFLLFPNKNYLAALKGYKVNVPDYGVVPYVRKESFFRLVFTRGYDSGWKQGTIAYNLPEWFVKWRWKL